MNHPSVTNKHVRGPLACTLQEEDWYADEPRIVAEEVIRGGQEMLELTVYHIRDENDPDPDDAPEISDVVLLPRDAWETLVTMFALRHAEAAARIVARAQGWKEVSHAHP